MIELREHQKDCIDALRNSISRGIKRLLVKAPCSFGKTIVFCEIAKNVSKKSKKTLIIVDNVALVRQTVDKLTRFVGMDEVGIFCATLSEKEFKKITVGTIQSLKECKVDLVIIDEAHQGLNRVQKFLENFNGFVIGFTATPFTSKGEKIYGKEDSFFSELTYSVPAKIMIAKGFITPMKYHGESEETKVDLSNVKIVSGDYDMGQAEEAFLSQKEKMILQVDDMLSRVKNRKRVIIMTTGIKHANTLSKMIEGSIAYHSDILDEERDRILKDFESGKYKFLIGVMAIYIGLDISCVDTIINMRPVRSYSLFIQLAGRAVRKHEGKEDALFLDYGQTVERLGFYEEFDEKEYEAKKRTGEAPVKKCPKCFLIMFASCAECSECGHKFPKRDMKSIDKLDIVAYEGEKEKTGVIYSHFFASSTFGNTIMLWILQEGVSGAQKVEFKYSKSSSYALILWKIHASQVIDGRGIIWKVVKGKYNNIVRIYDR